VPRICATRLAAVAPLTPVTQDDADDSLGQRAHLPRRQGTKLDGRLPPLLALASPPALQRADNPIRSAREPPATLNTLSLGPRMRFPILSPTLLVDPLPVPLTPVLRLRTMAFPAA
jgi:hypothetical protein